MVDVLPWDLPYPGARLRGDPVFRTPNVVSEPKIEVALVDSGRAYRVSEHS